MRARSMPLLLVVAVVGGRAIAEPTPAAAAPVAPPAARAAGDPVLDELLPPDPSDPAYAQVLENNRRRFLAEKALRKLKLSHFGVNRDPERRAAGLAIVRTYTDPATYPALLAAFDREAADVRLGVLDHLAAQRNPDADINLAYAAVYDRDDAVRGGAAERLAARVDELGETPVGVRSVVAAGLRFDSTIAQAASLASRLELFEAIPLLIQAQTAAVGSGGGDGDTYRAYIVVGRQISFVSDVTPVVGAGAVGFDPSVGVITEGSVLAIRDAFVTVYQTTVLPSLRALATQAWGGRSVDHLGADPGAWQRWYKEELVPYQRARGHAARAAGAGAEGR